MKRISSKIIAISVLSLFIFSPAIMTGFGPLDPSFDEIFGLNSQSLPPLRTAVEGITADLYDSGDPGVDEKYLESNTDISKHLMNNEMDYQRVWEPWLTKAAVRCIATDPSNEFLAVGGGYLYDNEIHIYRWNAFTREYDKVWDSGDQIIQGDVLSIAFGDTDNNDFMDIAAGSADGHVYVFEQEHIYDPYDNMENQFVHVWTSPKIQQVWGVAIADIDKDYVPDVIAGSWDKKVHIYEYTNHSGYPFNDEHWIEYTEKATIDVGEKVFSLSTGDTNYNALPEIVVGTELGRVYIYENNGTILHINGKPWPLTQDNSYRYHWDSGDVTWKPVLRVIVDNLDDDDPDEIAYIAVGQDTIVINYEDLPIVGERYLTHRLWAPLESWQLGGLEGLGHYLNHYIDFMTWSNNEIPSVDTFNSYTLSSLNASMLEGAHVYYSNIVDDVLVPEPHAYGWEPQWPKNTSMAIHRKLDPWGEDGVYIDMNGDGVVDDTEIMGIRDINHDPAENYTVFNARNTYASAIVDWGKDQEVMGDGLFAIPEENLGYDVLLRFNEWTLPQLNKISFEVSRGDNQWALIPIEDISLAQVSSAPGDDDLLIDIDPLLSEHRWSYFRYMRINVTDHGYFMIKGGYAPVLYRPMDAATSLTIGSLDLDYYKAYTSGQSEGKKIVLGTSDGKLIMFEYKASTHSYDLLWNSYTNDSYTQGTNIWDIVEVQSPGKIPTWLYNETKSQILRDIWEVPVSLDEKIFELEVQQSLPPGFYGEFASVTHVSLFSAFFTAIFETVPAFQPFLDIFELKVPENDMVVGTTNGKLIVVPELTHELSELAQYFFLPVNANPFYNGKSISPRFVDFNGDADYFPEIMLLSWAGNAPGDLYDPALGNYATAGLDVYTYDPLVGPLGMYTGQFELKDLEITGLLSRALQKSQRMPEVAVGDVDGDGDQDIVLTNGRIYFIENVNNVLFILDPDYFEDLNTKATDKLFDAPELYDYDGDGDLDLTVGWSNRQKSIVSTTYFQNVGYRWAPRWEENKWLYTNSWGGLRFNNLTHAAFAYDKAGKVSHLTTYNTHTHQLIQLYAEYDNHNAYVIGTNPIIARLEINLKSGTDSHLTPIANYGYHIFETWNSEAELERWTLTLETGDMDQDGRNEVIVGDFDNNLYVFEHLTNNTYKRAFRSQDITHTELSTQSPYAWDQLEGVSGTFYRTIWDHVEELVVGLDMDNDGFLEMVATAGLSIFVWEQRNNGWVSVDDEYTLIWQADLRQSAWAPLFQDLGITQFTAAAYGGDLDYNGFGEFVLAAGSFLFVFESNGADQFHENFLVDPYPVRGRYFIPGNPLSSASVRTLSIESIVIADTDNDTLNEIILGGVNKTWWGQYNGFVAILENQVGTYAYSWWAPMHLMEDNPVYDISVDNQDYDEYKEIVVGTFKGVVIYENSDLGPNDRDNYYLERSILTSFVNFPYMKLKQMFDVEAKVQLALRNTDFLELQFDFDGFYNKGLWIQIFKAGQALYWAVSSDYGDSWSQKGQVSTTAIFDAGGTVPYSYSAYEYHPSIFQTRDGRIFLSFTGDLVFQPGASAPYHQLGIWLFELTENAGSYFWINAVNSVAIDGTINFLYNPSVWAYGVNVDQGVAISYMNASDGGIYWQDSFINPTADPEARIPNIGYSAITNNLTWGRNGYRAISHDAIRSTSGDVVIVFTGMKFDEAKIDYDLWIAKSNASTMWDEALPYSRATSDAIDELHPSITQTITPDRTLMVIFEADGNLPSGALQITYSKDDGNTWREPESVTTTPPFATYRVFPVFGFSLMVLKDNPNIVIKSLISVGPAITPHFTGGFAYSFMSQYSFYSLASFSPAKVTTNSLTVNQGYAQQVGGSTAQISTGDISAHSGLVQVVGGSMTTGGGQLSYQGELVGSFFNISAGGGSALSYVSSSPSTPIVHYTTPIVTQEQGIVGYGGNLVAYGDDATGSDNPGSDTNTGYQSGRLFGSAFGGDFHTSEKDPNRGFYNNIFFGMNPSSDFTKFDFKEARAIDVGDSDKDYRREIAVASGSQAYLVEVSRTGGTWDENKQVLEYYQSWQSDSFITETSDIALYDSNGNGMDEVLISCLQGNVYSFEGMITDPPATELLYIDRDLLWENDSYEGGFWSRDPSPEVLVVETDVNEDGYDDVLLGLMDPDSGGYMGYPVIQALDGPTGDEFWVFNLSTSQNSLSKNSSILWMKAHDLNADGTDDLIFLAFDYDAQAAGSRALWLYGLIMDETNPVESWVPVPFDWASYYHLNEFISADIDGDLILDIVISLSNEVFWIRGNDGNDEDGPYPLYSVGTYWEAEHITSGNNTLLISSRDTQSSNGTVAYIDVNGTIIHEYQLNNTDFGLTAVQMSFTEDAHEDILILESGVIFAYDGLINRSQQLWNMSLENSVGNYEDTLRYDFNDDSFEDVMFQVMGTSGSFIYTAEDFFEGERIAHKIEGLTFSNLNNTALQGWIAINLSVSSVTPHSGDMMFWTYETDNFITIESDAYIVSGWFGTSSAYLSDYVWTAYDKDGNFLTNTTFAHSTPIQYAELRDPLGRINTVKVTGTGPAGWEGNWVIDDFRYESFGPTKLMAFSGLDLQESLWEYHVWNSYVPHIFQGDMDNDGRNDDLLFSTVYQGSDYDHTGEIKVIDGSQGTPLFFYEFGGFLPYFSLGNFAEFGDIAVLTQGGYSAMMTYVRYEPTHYRNIAVQDNDSISFETRGTVTKLAVGDFNADGSEDIIFGDRARYLIALDGLTGEMIWKYRVSTPISRIAIEDFHLQDGYDDVAIALKSGLLVIVNGETGRPIWEDYLGPVVVNGMEFIDTNRDGTVEELAISLGFRFTHLWGRFDLYNVTVDTSTGRGSIIWQKYQPFAPFTQFEAADFRGTGNSLDIAVAIYEHSIWVLNGIDGSIIRAFPVKVHDFAIGTFVTGQSLPMIAVIIRNGTVTTYESADWLTSVSQAAKIHLDIPFRLSHMTVRDFDNNGDEEIVVHSFGDGSFKLNGKLTTIRWFFEDRSTFYLPKYLVADMNNDGVDDILSLNHDNIFALDGLTGEVVWASFLPSYLITTMTIGDFNGDGIQDVAVGTADRWIYILHGKVGIIIPQEYSIIGKQLENTLNGNTVLLPSNLPLTSIANNQFLFESSIIAFFALFGVLILPATTFLLRRRRK
jgi:hypothetical protein